VVVCGAPERRNRDNRRTFSAGTEEFEAEFTGLDSAALIDVSKLL
jgi:hypothetical protein